MEKKNNILIENGKPRYNGDHVTGHKRLPSIHQADTRPFKKARRTFKFNPLDKTVPRDVKDIPSRYLARLEEAYSIIPKDWEYIVSVSGDKYYNDEAEEPDLDDIDSVSSTEELDEED